MNAFDPTFRLDNTSDSVRTIRAKIAAWMTSPWLADLVELYEGDISQTGTLDNALVNLEAFSEATGRTGRDPSSVRRLGLRSAG